MLAGLGTRGTVLIVYIGVHTTVIEQHRPSRKKQACFKKSSLDFAKKTKKVVCNLGARRP